MWKLIIIPILCLSLLVKQETKILILDDCKYWKKGYHNEELGQFAIVFDNLKNNQMVLLSNRKVPNESPYEVLTIKYSELMKKKFLFSSELTYKNWVDLEQKRTRLLILRPEDFCSNKRFNYNQLISLYEVHIRVSRDE